MDKMGIKKYVYTLLAVVSVSVWSVNTSAEPGATDGRPLYFQNEVMSVLGTTPYGFNVKDYGAKGDGTGNDAPSINKTIAAAAAAGGGTVVLPPGTYLCGSIRLQSNIHLVIMQGAVIEAINAREAYDQAEPNPWDKYQDFGHSHWHNGLLWGENLENISITGSGMIHGKGLTRNMKRDAVPVGLGDKAIALKNCRNVLLRDFTVYHGGHFALLATGVNNLTIDNLKIDTNRDGLDLDGCKNVKVSNCSINTPWDDAICLKSSFALGFATTTENMTITNCFVSGFQEGTMLDGTYKPMDSAASHATGRIKFGTESNGGFKNIAISNCVFDHCHGLALETVDGALLEDIAISNITMRNINNSPIFLRLGSRMRAPEGTAVGQLRRVNISDIVVYNADRRFASIISGIPGHHIEDVKISNVRIIYEGGGTKEDAAIKPPEEERSYPDPRMFGVIPSYGFYIRHATGIELSNITLRYDSVDERPPFILEDVAGADFSRIKAQREAGAATFMLHKVKNFTLSESRDLEDQKIDLATHKIF